METMQHQAAATATDSKKPGIIARIRGRLAGVLVTFSMVLLGGAGAANAAVPGQTDPATDPLAGSGDSLFTSLKDYLTGHLVPAVVGLIVVSIAVGMLIKWGSKGAKKA